MIIIKETKNKLYIKINNKYAWISKNEIENIEEDIKKEEEKLKIKKMVSEAIKKDYENNHKEFLKWREKNKDKLEDLTKKMGW